MRLARSAAVLLGVTCGAAQASGYVLAVQGDWRVDAAGAPLAVGAEVPAGAKLVVASPGPSDRIVIVARSGAVLVARRCAIAADCLQALLVPAESDAAPRAWLSRIVERFVSEPDRYVVTLSRQPPLLLDIVTAASAGVLDLAPAFPRLAAGDYDIGLTPLRCLDDSCPTVPPARWTLGRDHAVALPWRGAGRGLYELNVVQRSGEFTAMRLRSRVLIVAAQDRDGIAARFAEAVATADGWGDDVDASVQLGFQRAALDVLAGSR